MRNPILLLDGINVEIKNLNMFLHFHDRDDEDPYNFLIEFENIIITLDNNISDQTSLTNFPLILKDKDKSWFNYIPLESITIWQ